MDDSRFSRNIGLISPAEQERLSQAIVVIAGTGTDGGLLAERLVLVFVRCSLVDPDMCVL